jgi:deoxyribonuclease V
MGFRVRCLRFEYLGNEIVPRVPLLHSWDLDTAQAGALQIELASRVDTSRPLTEFDTVAGGDVSYDLQGRRLFGAIVVAKAGTEEILERSSAVAPARFPYVPGLFSFREAPVLVEAYEGLRTRPDVLLLDGQGIAHPRRLGLASHLGLWLGIATIGCAKSRLCGEHDEPGEVRGDWRPLTFEGQTVGAVLRTRDRIKPVYVSPGHFCDLRSAIRVVLENANSYRLPNPARLAHHYATEMRRNG